MANTDTPRGLVPLRYRSGGPYNGATNLYCIPATDSTVAYVGAVVKPAGSADATGVMTVTANVSTGNAVLGPIVAVRAVTRDSTIHREASTLRYVFVADDPNLEFVCQDDAAAALAATNVGMVADLTNFTSGTASTGLSQTEISAATATASGDGTEDVQLVGLYQVPGNDFGANAKWVVRLNNHYSVDASPGA